MEFNELLLDALDRVRSETADLLSGITEEALYYRADPQANTIAWLAWHVARGQDAQVAGLAGTEQVWVTGGWADRMRLPLGPSDNGYGDSPEEVARVRTDPALLTDYLEAVTEVSGDYLRSLSAADLDRVIDDSWDPPVTVGTRLISVIADDLQHVGQAAYVRGLAERSA